MTVKCFQCHKEVCEEDARTVGQCITVCNSCYRDLKSLIFKGYFDEEKLEDEMLFEASVEHRINFYAQEGNMKQPYYVKRACETLLSKVRYEKASFTLYDHCISESKTDTAAIKAATQLYVETWIVPLIEAIRDGDKKKAEDLTY